MNATLEIDSQPGAGTQLKLIIPFVAPTAEDSLLEAPSHSADNALGETGEQPSAA
jgi:hypothetical protein